MSSCRPEHDAQTLWSLEALRGVAAWMVVYAHYAPFANIDIPLLRFAYTGVDLFFVLSGFVFAPYLLGRKLVPTEFAIRRAFRIYPAYLAALVLYLGLKLASGLPAPYFAEHLVFAHLQSREMAFFYNPAFWSLPAEVEFYLFLPLMARLTRGEPVRFAFLFGIALGMRLALGYFANPTAQNTAYVALHHLPGMLVEFLLGGFAWQIAQSHKYPKLQFILPCLGVMGWLLLAYTFAKLGNQGIDATVLRNQTSWLAGLAFAMMLPKISSMPETSVKPIIQAALLWAGRLSYGTYLLHFAALNFVTEYLQPANSLNAVFTACILTFGCSWLLYQFWENPWRKFGRLVANRASAK